MSSQSRPSTSPVLKNLEALSAGERERFDDLYQMIHPAGVCINVMVTPQPWDIRPLFLDRGIVWIYRLSQELTEGQCSDLQRTLAAAQGILDSEASFGKVTERNQVWTKRRYFQGTLLDEVRNGTFNSQEVPERTVQQLLSKIHELHGRGEVHGHIWLGNLALLDGKLRILDPILGTYPRPLRTGLPDVAPEVVRGSSDMSSDVYGIAAVALHLFGERISSDVRQQLESILSTPPARRPRLSEVTTLLSPPTAEVSPSRPPVTGPATGVGGKVIGAAKPSRKPEAPDPSASRSNSDLAGMHTDEAQPAAHSADFVARGVDYSKRNPLLVGVCSVVILILVVHYFSPATYYRIARIIPAVDREMDPQLENDWASGDRNRMKEVARLAVIDRRPAAENAIVASALSGAKPASFDANMIRVAYDERWADELSERDRRSSLALATREILPEGLSKLSPIETLHPGVILAVTGQMDIVDPPQHLSAVGTDQFGSLPSPLGDFFSALSKIGVKTLNQPGALAACRIATGASSPAVLEAYFANKSELAEVFARLAALMVVIDQSKELGDAVAAVLKDGGGPVGQALGWFDGEDVSQWASVSGASRLSLLLGKLPRKTFSVEQYSDLLLFPLPAVRGEALKALIRQYLTEKSAPMLAVIASDQSRLTRKQVVALVSALHLRTDSAGSFVSVWFQTAPDPLTVLRLLNARAGFEIPDTFNLEAARYLRKSTWQASFEDLKTLSAHPEPLARSLAYGKLSISIPGEAEVLRARLGAETDPALKITLQQRLNEISREVGKPLPEER